MDTRLIKRVVKTVYPDWKILKVTEYYVLFDNTESPEPIKQCIFAIADECKLWAKLQGKDIWSGPEDDYYIALVNPDFRGGEEYYETEYAEPEAVIKACDWIIKKSK